MSNNLDLSIKPVFIFEIGLIGQDEDSIDFSDINAAVKSCFGSNKKSLNSGDGIGWDWEYWEIAVETAAMGYPRLIITLQRVARYRPLQSPSILVSIPWGFCKKDLEQVAEFVRAVTDQLECYVVFNDRKLTHPPEQVVQLYTETGEKSGRILKGMLDRACIMTSVLKPVTFLELSASTRNCLQDMGARIVSEIVVIKELELLKSQNLDRKSLNELKAFLHDEKLSLDMEIDLFSFSQAVSHVLPHQVIQNIATYSRISNEHYRNFIRILADYVSPAFIQ